jgi:hypothetical protein
MDVTRPHLSFPTEWITASIFLVATLVVGSLIVRELRVPSTLPAAATLPQSVVQPTVPSDAVSAPTLVLGNGVELAVGEPVATAESKLAAATLADRTSERGPLGPREIRFYNLAGTRFIIVVEPFERGGEMRIAGIYLR